VRVYDAIIYAQAAKVEAVKARQELPWEYQREAKT